MARKDSNASGSGRTTALAPIKAQALTHESGKALVAALGSDRALAKLPGSGGEVARQAGVIRVTGRDYATRKQTVPAAEIYFVDGGRPAGDGVWLGEADKVASLDPETGYECIMMRDNPAGFLSGYVGVPESHPLFGWNHDAVPAELGIEVHGGLTYSRICQGGPSPQGSLVLEARRICHVVVSHAPLRHATEYRAHDDAWWFGFQCNHLFDAAPGMQGASRGFMGAETPAEYRDDAYVVREILNLASQLKAIADGVPPPAREGPSLPAIGLDPRRGGCRV